MTMLKEFKIHAPSEVEEPLTEFLSEIGCLGFSIQNQEDLKGIPDLARDTVWGIKEEDFPKSGMILHAYFPETQDLTEIKKKITEKMEELETYGFAVRPYFFESDVLQEEDWANAWKQHYHSLRVTRFLTIIPKWETYAPEQEAEHCLFLDPGLAFGTGTHPTTILSLQALETIIRGGETVFDVGTGSGVLTIASALLGAKEIYAYDVDESAVSSAKENISLNQLNAKIEVKQNNLLKGITKEADIVVANILADILLLLMADAFKAVKEGGFFVGSGVIHSKKEEVLAALEQQGFELLSVFQMKDWVSFIAQKPETTTE